VATVLVRIDQAPGLTPPSTAIDAADPAESMSVPVLGQRGLGTVTTPFRVTVGRRTARRLRAFAVLMHQVRIVLRPFAFALVAMSFFTMMTWREHWYSMVPLILCGLLTIGYVAALWIVRAPQQPVDTGLGWIEVRRVDPAAARDWQERNPAAGIVVRP